MGENRKTVEMMAMNGAISGKKKPLDMSHMGKRPMRLSAAKVGKKDVRATVLGDAKEGFKASPEKPWWKEGSDGKTHRNRKLTKLEILWRNLKSRGG